MGSGACASNVPAESNAPKMNVAFVVYIRWILPSASIVLTGQWMCRHGDGGRVAVGQLAGTLTRRPFAAIQDEIYLLYLKVEG